MNPTFYVLSTNDQLNMLKTSILKCDPEFVSKLAVYAREKMYLRSVPLVLLVELAKTTSGKQYIRKAIRRVVQRADEITELVAYYQKANKAYNRSGIKRLSNQIKRGLKDVFESGRFNEYHYAKYNRPGEVKFRDVMFLTHPKPKNLDQRDLFKKIVDNTLSTPYTWETEMSKAGKESKGKKEVWEELIDSGNMGYMALLRNLRNFLSNGVSDIHISKVCGVLKNEDMVLKSKQLPFRFLSASRSIKDYRNEKVNGALETALRYSIKNVPVFNNERVLIASDVSGSMIQPISRNSSINLYDIGLLL
jgi:hypothetical protein